MTSRRKFLKRIAGVGGTLALSSFGFQQKAVQQRKTKVAFVKTNDRLQGTARTIDLLQLPLFKGADVFIKPNFNSADETPGSTHRDTLVAVVGKLRELGANRITLGDRSGMGNTHDVMEAKEIFRLSRDLGIKAIVFDELPAEEWKLFHLPGAHWRNGFALPLPVLRASKVVQTCCLKTHQFGGHFTMSLKNSVGLAAKHIPGNSYNFMSELHSSPFQRQMIAEINAAYQPDAIVLDGVDAFVAGGPASGNKVSAQVIIAGTDRVAVDAVGIAVLRYFGTTHAVGTGAIFEQDQIARAVELGIGVESPEQIELVTDDPESATYAATVAAILKND